MTESCSVLIDLSEAGLDLDRAEMESFLRKIADEMESGNLVQSVRLARDEDIPESAKGVGALLVGILTTEIDLKNLGKVINYLGSLRLHRQILTLTFECDGEVRRIEYRNKQELQEAIDAIDRLALSNLRIKMWGEQTTSETDQTES